MLIHTDSFITDWSKSTFYGEIIIQFLPAFCTFAMVYHFHWIWKRIMSAADCVKQTFNRWMIIIKCFFSARRVKTSFLVQISGIFETRTDFNAHIKNMFYAFFWMTLYLYSFFVFLLRIVNSARPPKIKDFASVIINNVKLLLPN